MFKTNGMNFDFKTGGFSIRFEWQDHEGSCFRFGTDNITVSVRISEFDKFGNANEPRFILNVDTHENAFSYLSDKYYRTLKIVCDFMGNHIKDITSIEIRGSSALVGFVNTINNEVVSVEVPLVYPLISPNSGAEIVRTAIHQNLVDTIHSS